jgi:acid stress-induced BolA-like protein IbaG/YrbA
MNKQQLTTLLETALPGAIVMVNGDDGVHFDAIIIYKPFEGLTKVKQQQLVYEVVGEKIRSGELHALALKTYTPEQWTAIQQVQND